MAQHDYALANQSGAAFRSDANDALAAIATLNAGTSAPATTFAHMWWADTSANLLKRRNAANSAWITIGPIDDALRAATESVAGIAELATQAEVNAMTDDARIVTALKLATGLGPIVGGLTADTAPDADADEVLTVDASASDAGKRVALKTAVRRAGAPVLLGTLTANGSSGNLDFTAFDNAKYHSYEFHIVGLQPATDATALHAIMDSDGGASYDTGASAYGWQRTVSQFIAAGTATPVGDDADAQIVVAASLESDGRKLNGFARLRVGSAFSDLRWELSYQASDGNRYRVEGAGQWLGTGTGAVNAIRFYAASGNLTAGVIYCYGIPFA